MCQAAEANLALTGGCALPPPAPCGAPRPDAAARGRVSCEGLLVAPSRRGAARADGAPARSDGALLGAARVGKVCSIASVSALPAHAADVRAAAEWFVARLTASGFDAAAAHETALHPVVTAEALGADEGAPTLLIYGHFDVQPGDPFDLWTTPPFEPSVRSGSMYARGVSDNKGQILAAIDAAAAVLAEAKARGERPPINFKVLVEGCEEYGSAGIPEWVAANRALLKADAALSTDGMQPVEGGALMLGLRGLAMCQIDAHSASIDLHSGVYGGVVANPLHAVAAALAALRDPQSNRITVPGFYDGVADPTAEELADWAASAPDEATLLAAVGLPPGHYGGEEGRSWAERNWARPTLEVVGMHGGFQGDGMKTVLPREAHAKIACRLVPGQDPDKVHAGIKSAILGMGSNFAGVQFNVSCPEGAAAYIMPKDLPLNRAAATVLEGVYGSKPGYVRWGATVPIVPLLHKELGLYTTTVGFGLEDDKWHSPDEVLDLERFSMAADAYVELYHRYAQEGRAASAQTDRSEL